MTTAMNTRRALGKRLGYEGINTHFRGLKIYYTSET